MIRFATLLGSMSTFDTDSGEESSIADLIRRNSLALETLYGSDDDEPRDQLIGSFPSLLLTIHDGDDANIARSIQGSGSVELEDKAAQSLSSRISVFGKSRGRADRMRTCDDLHQEHLYEICDIPHVPNEVLNNLCSSFMRLLFARIKAYAVLLLRHYSNVAKYTNGSSSGKKKIDNVMAAQEEIMELLWSQTFIQTAVTSFQVLPTVDAPTSFSKDEMTATLPIIFEATLDVMIMGELTSFRINTDGFINGKWIHVLNFSRLKI